MAFLEFYKKGQGTAARLLALLSAFGLAFWGGYALWKTLLGYEWAATVLLPIERLGVDITLSVVLALAVTAGLCFGIVWFLNRPRAVDLLLETEGEMKKVSWPSRQEAWNSSMVVVVTVLFMMGLLFFYDVLLNYVLGLFFA